ncbi:hypothetical protein SMKI_01G0840 [Saccharomyces mikatae IFO 1815]|uniref:Uncharacterized protein n=1 Tax=Saccharomyces mikatae IFO 1815 TaxID=226126 RepID=A0AA35NGE5_SACMI|nr:uncharacterized protein SMKI_01G0840 [Saccharomyces mikatae IFO 1815]CAI4037125.1 hypothetical protein SMKI_01G0840 [Saccharomyces mikatae IFO 1815]
MNQYLLDNTLWNTPYYFYSEKKCSKFFKGLVGLTRSSALFKSPTNGAENTQPNTPANEVSNEIARFYIYSPDPLLEAYFVEAAEVDQEAQREYRRKQYPNARAL